MGRFYKINQHGPIEDYAYEMPFKELFTMQKYKRAEEEKADEALKAGYDKILNLNYKPGDEAKVEQLRKNFTNLSDNVYKKYGNNLANATSSINQGISEVMDAGLFSDINANYKTWAANEASKADLYKSGKFQPDFKVDQQGSRDTESNGRDYDQYLASTDVRPNQQEIYDDIPEDQRTWARLQQSASSSALQYGMSHPQDLIQRYGPSIQPLLQAAQMGDPAAQQELYEKSYAMLEETLPEFVNNAAVDGSNSSGGSGGGGADYVSDHMNDLLAGIEDPRTPTVVSIRDVGNMMGTDTEGNYIPNAIPLITGSEDVIVRAGQYNTGTGGFVETSPGVYSYGDDYLNREASAAQTNELAAIHNYYDKYQTHLEALQEDNQSATIEDLKANPNLDKSALRKIEELGIDIDDPNTKALYDAHIARKKKLRGEDERLAKAQETMLTALNAPGMAVDFRPITGEDNIYISLDSQGNAVFNVKGVGVVTESQIDNLIKTNRSFSEGFFGPDQSTENGYNPLDNPWNEPPGKIGGSAFSLVGKDNIFQKLNDSQVVIDGNAVKSGDPLYQFDMTHKVPVTYQTWKKYNEGRYQGTPGDAPLSEKQWRTNMDEAVKELRRDSKINSVQLSTKTQMNPIVKVTGNRNNENIKLTGFEPIDVDNPNIMSLTPEAASKLGTSYTTTLDKMVEAENNGSPNMDVYMDMYSALYDSLVTQSLDKTDATAVEDYRDNLKDFLNVQNYLDYKDPATGQVGDSSTAMRTLIETSEFTYDTGVVDDVIKDPVKLKKYTGIKAKAKNLIEIDSGNLKNIGVSGDLYGPYTTGKGIQVLNAFNTELERKGLSTTVTSAFRTQSYNETLPESAEASLHLSGKAFDLRDGQGAKALYERWKTSNGAAFGGSIKAFHPHNVGGVVHYHVELK